MSIIIQEYRNVLEADKNSDSIIQRRKDQDEICQSTSFCEMNEEHIFLSML